MSDTMTVLEACVGEGILAKRITPSGIVAYGNATFFDLFSIRISGLRDVGVALKTLLCRPRAMVVRGVPLLRETKTLRRLSHAQADYPATLGRSSHRWLDIDLDDVPFPPGVAAKDLVGCGEAARTALPPEFRAAVCIAQATAGHGIKTTMRLRLWYWLDRAISDGEAKRWLMGSPADVSLYSAAQPHYTAAPVFEGGLRDHLPARLAVLPGAREVAVPPSDALAPPPREPRSVPQFTCPEAARSYVRDELRDAVERVMHAPMGSRHRVLVSQAARVAPLVSNGWIGEGAYRAALTAAAREADPEEAEEGIASALAWGLASAASESAGEIFHE